MTQSRRPHFKRLGRSQGGTTIIEFALVALLFFSILLGIADFGRWLFAVHASSESARLGARVAVVCDVAAPAVRARMRSLLPSTVSDQSIQIEYLSAAAADPVDWEPGCTAETCAAVRVHLAGVTIPSVAWFLPAQIPVPTLSVTLTRESLHSAIDGSPNELCN
jgi:Flp pilus assembly protein TadG